MGSIIGRLQNGYSDQPWNPNAALENQVFVIKGDFYTLIEKLGGGTFGSVWSAMSSRGYPAAVKAIDISRPEFSMVDRLRTIDSFEKEVKMAYRMRQATRHVVTIYGFDFDPRTGLALLAMELGGDTLTKRIEMLNYMKSAKGNRGSNDRFPISADFEHISPIDRKNIWVQLVNIVQTLHQHRVVHRDMKPDNLVFFGPIMKIVDLGIAQKEILGYNPSMNPIGTPYFSAPECFQLGAQVSSKADIWSAGAILYYMTYGQPPLENTYHPLPGYFPTGSPYVKKVLRGCLQRNPFQRKNHQWLARTPLTANPGAF